MAFENVDDCIKFLESNSKIKIFFYHKFNLKFNKDLKLNNEKTKFLCKESLPALKASDIALSKHITSNL